MFDINPGIFFSIPKDVITILIRHHGIWAACPNVLPEKPNNKNRVHLCALEVIPVSLHILTSNFLFCRISG